MYQYSSLLLILRKCLVCSLVHQFLEVLDPDFANLDLGYPATARTGVLGAVVDGGGLLLQQLVDGCDGACDGRVDIGSGLDGFHSANGIARSNLHGDGWELDIDDIAQSMRCVLGDANGSGLVIWGQLDPLVVLGEPLCLHYRAVRVVDVVGMGGTGSPAAETENAREGNESRGAATVALELWARRAAAGRKERAIEAMVEGGMWELRGRMESASLSEEDLEVGYIQ